MTAPQPPIDPTRYARLVRLTKIHRRQLHEAHTVIARQRAELYRVLELSSARRMVSDDRIALLTYQLDRAHLPGRFAKSYSFLAGCLVGLLVTYVVILRGA